MRINFLCGQRALRDYQRALGSLQKISAELSIHQDELGETVTRIQERLKSTNRELAKTRKALMGYEAQQLWDEAPETNGMRKIFAHWEDYSFEDIRAIAENLRQRPKTLALLAATEGQNIRFLSTRSDDLSKIDASAILKYAINSLSGRGGGTSSMAQGGAPVADHKTIIDAFQEALRGIE